MTLRSTSSPTAATPGGQNTSHTAIADVADDDDNDDDDVSNDDGTAAIIITVTVTTTTVADVGMGDRASRRWSGQTLMQIVA